MDIDNNIDIFARFRKEAAARNFRMDSPAARRWYQQEAKKLYAAHSSLELMREMGLTSRLSVGQLVMFFYDPKYKETLPYYDRFPLDIVLSVEKEHFTCLNLHYLPVPYRLAMIAEILQIQRAKTINDKTKLKVSYQMIKSMSSLKALEPCIKKYLKSHVKSKFAVVNPKDYQLVAAMPLERFEKASTRHIHRQTRKKFR
jgi:hypothetical protein